jgi:hypothetical protein
MSKERTNYKTYWTEEGFKKRKKCHIYIIKANSVNYYKIGSAMNVEHRLKTLQIGNPSKLRIIYASPICRRGIEGEVHRNLKKYKHRGEWYKLNKEDLSFAINTIKENCMSYHKVKLLQIKLRQQALIESKRTDSRMLVELPF